MLNNNGTQSEPLLKEMSLIILYFTADNWKLIILSYPFGDISLLFIKITGTFMCCSRSYSKCTHKSTRLGRFAGCMAWS